MAVVEPCGGGVADFDDEIRESCFFQCRFEGFDQRVRQFADESDRVRQQDVLSARQTVAADGRIQRSEQFVLRKDARMRHRVEQRRFARVRVADDRRDGHWLAQPFGPLDLAVLLDVFQLPLELGDVVADDTRVDVQLLLAFAFGAHAARLAALPVQMRPTAFQPRKGVVGLRKLDLKRRLVGLCMGGEDVENDLLPVDDGQ